MSNIIKVKAGVRYWEDAEVSGVEDTEGTLIPFRNGELWCPVIDADTGKIIDWPQGTTASVHYKVVDCFSFRHDDNGIITEQHEDYVPSWACPEENGYGDYVIMEIDREGQIANWKKPQS